VIVTSNVLKFTMIMTLNDVQSKCEPEDARNSSKTRQIEFASGLVELEQEDDGPLSPSPHQRKSKRRRCGARVHKKQRVEANMFTKPLPTPSF